MGRRPGAPRGYRCMGASPAIRCAANRGQPPRKPGARRRVFKRVAEIPERGGEIIPGIIPPFFLSARIGILNADLHERASSAVSRFTPQLSKQSSAPFPTHRGIGNPWKRRAHK